MSYIALCHILKGEGETMRNFHESLRLARRAKVGLRRAAAAVLLCAALFVACRGHQAGRLIVTPKPRRFGIWQGFAVDDDLVALLDDDGRAVEHLAVNRYAALRDPAFGIAAGAQACTRHAFGDALALDWVVGFRFGHDPHRVGRTLGRVYGAGMSDMSSNLSPMAQAFAEAEAAGRRGEVPVGAVVVDSRSGQVLAAAGNRTEQDADPTAHAEILAIRAAAQAVGEPRLPDCDLYVTLEPCAMCAAAIAFARVRRVYYGAYDPKGGAVEHGPRWFQQPTCHHRPEVYGGIEEGRAGALLREFFAARRE